MKKIISILLLLVIMCFASYADSFKVVTLGDDLSDKQKNDMLEMFHIKEGDADIITVTNEEEKEYLGGIAPQSQIGTRAISSSYVEPLSDGKGLKVHTLNLTWVTEDMISNALITAGIKDAKVIAAAPFKVSGTAALTGIMKGFEKATGERLSPKAKDAANREMITTGKLGEEVGQNKAVQFMNDVKKEVVENKVKNTDDIRTIIEKVAKHNDINLSEDQINQVIDVMKRISQLDINIQELTKQVKNISDKISQVIHQNEETKSILQKIVDTLQKIVEKLSSLFK